MNHSRRGLRVRRFGSVISHQETVRNCCNRCLVVLWQKAPCSKKAITLSSFLTVVSPYCDSQPFQDWRASLASESHDRHTSVKIWGQRHNPAKTTPPHAMLPSPLALSTSLQVNSTQLKTSSWPIVISIAWPEDTIWPDSPGQRSASGQKHHNWIAELPSWARTADSTLKVSQLPPKNRG